MKALAVENAKLKKLVAEQLLAIEVLEQVNEKSGDAHGAQPAVDRHGPGPEPASGRSPDSVPLSAD